MFHHSFFVVATVLFSGHVMYFVNGFTCDEFMMLEKQGRRICCKWLYIEHDLYILRNQKKYIYPGFWFLHFVIDFKVWIYENVFCFWYHYLTIVYVEKVLHKALDFWRKMKMKKVTFIECSWTETYNGDKMDIRKGFMSKFKYGMELFQKKFLI